ncbi:Predicted RNA-binding protein containing a PIN domain [Micromonospora zamorensis]|nr:NYN domain-containing protein [Micromonospora zamorensis]SCG59652.1 Predicted RNA-binding protein containing a PIN domain [Micromonospora zamorensis]
MPLAEPHDDHLPQEDLVALDGAVSNPDDNVVSETSGASDPTAAGDGPGTESESAESESAVSEPEPALPEPEPTLPEPVRQRIVTLTAAVLPTLPADEVPVPLRRVAKFAPNRRARLGAPVIAAQLTADPLFRQRVTARVLADAGDLGAAVVEGTAPAAADPVEVAALAYLARPRGWRELIDASGAAVRAEADSAVVAELVREAEQRATRAEHDRAVARVEAEKLRDELARVREELGQLREESRQVARTLRETQARERKATELLATERGRAARASADVDAELRRARARLAEAEAAAGVARASAKESRSVDDARLWLLLETIGQAAVGLRRELALDPVDKLPADFVADAFAEQPGTAPASPAARARDTDDPARLDQLLALPRAHLVVDGYNVTKRGFGDMSLEQQRKRLITGLGGIAAQTGDEITVVFDGAERMHGLPPAPRGVRVLFSRKGETADELIRRLVRAEPAGRPVVVVSSDREVADGVRRHGAYPLGADSLLRRLARS